MKHFISSVLWFLSGVAIIVWYAIGGWTGVLKAAIAAAIGSVIAAWLFKWWHRRKQRAVVAIPEQTTGTLAHKYAHEGDGKLNDLEIARLSDWRGHPDVAWALGEVFSEGEQA